MTMLRRFVPVVVAIFTLIAGAPAPARAGDVVAAATGTAANPAAAVLVGVAQPDWVVTRDLAGPQATRLEPGGSGVAYLMMDRQVRVRSDGHDIWHRLVTRVTDRSGLESTGQLTAVFDPHFETVAVPYVHIIRGGKTIDLTATTHFQVVEHEDSLNEGIVAGTLKAIANLRDLRVGDLLDVAYVTRVQTSLWPGQFYDHFQQRFTDPLAWRGERYLWPAGMAGRWRVANGTVNFTTRKLGDQVEWEWIDPAPALDLGEAGVPQTAHQWGQVDISTMRDWRGLSAWAEGLYAIDTSLPSEFTTRLDAIAAAHSAAADRVTEATRLIEDTIRYVGEEMAEGSYVPRPPRLVLERGFGDCKDKSLLLALALRHLGIDAVPALASTTQGDTLNDRLPSPRLFNHVVVRLVIDGKVTWLDPTSTHRGGRGMALVSPDFGYGLPIRPGQAGLERMESYPANAGRMSVTEHFEVDEKAPTALTLHVETVYTGERADRMRASIADSGLAKLGKNNLDFYLRRFEGMLETRPFAFTDDRDANRLVTIEDYGLSRAAFNKDKISDKLVMRAYAMFDVLPDKQASPRRNPLALPLYVDNRQVIELRAKGRQLDMLDNLASEASGIAFSRRSTRLDDMLRMEFRLTSGGTISVPASDAAAIYTLSDLIKDEGGIEFYLNKAKKLGEQDNPDGLDPNVLAEIRPAIVKFGELIAKNDTPSQIEALSLITGAAAKVRHPSREAGLLDGMKGLVLASLRRPLPALNALRSATSQYEGNSEVFRMWIAFEIDEGTPQTAIAALRRTNAVQHEVAATLDENWINQLRRSIGKLAGDARDNARWDLCNALVEAGWQMEPRTEYGNSNLACAIEGHVRRGELDAAHAGLAANPGAGALATLALDRRQQALWPDLDRLGANGFRSQLDQDLTRARVIAKARPDDPKAVYGLMRALRRLGRLAEAMEAGKRLATDRAKIETLGDDGFQLVFEYANDLVILGQADRGFAAIDDLLGLGIETYPWLINVAIDRAALLNDAGRHDQAYAAAHLLAEKHDDKVSAFGRMWVWSELACSARMLGKLEEAKAAEAKLAAKPSDNWGAAVRAAACRGDTAAISDALVARLKDPQERLAALDQFADFGMTEPMLPYEAHLEQEMDKARATPAVRDAFEKVGRRVRYAGTRAYWSQF